MSLTIFTILKDNTDPHISMLQRNALMSWQRIQPAPEIIAFGQKPGVATLCEELGITNLEAYENDQGLEYVTHAFDVVNKASFSTTLMYCNADIILPPMTQSVIASINAQKYLAVGQRWNWITPHAIDFSPGWWSKLKAESGAHGSYHPPSGMDYFIFPQGTLEDLPPLLVGRWYWDNYMLRHARKSGVPIINITHALFAIHQHHDYKHFPGELEALSTGEESLWNKQWLEGDEPLNCNDADFTMQPMF